jgi:hypothetical protein
MAYQNITGIRIGQAEMTTSYLSVYNVPINTRTYVKDITVCNTTSSSINIYVSLVPAGGTVGTANAIFYNTALPGGTTVQWTGSQILDTSDTIQVKASATGCTITVTGGEAL